MLHQFPPNLTPDDGLYPFPIEVEHTAAHLDLWALFSGAFAALVLVAVLS